MALNNSVAPKENRALLTDVKLYLATIECRHRFLSQFFATDIAKQPEPEEQPNVFRKSVKAVKLNCCDNCRKLVPDQKEAQAPHKIPEPVEVTEFTEEARPRAIEHYKIVEGLWL